MKAPTLGGNTGASQVVLTFAQRNANASDEAYAQTLADKFNENDKASAFVAETLDAMEKAKRGPFAILVHGIVPVYGWDLIAAGLPFPGSKVETFGIRPDVFKQSRPGINNSTRQVDANILSVLTEDMSIVKQARAEIAYCNMATDAAKQADCPQEYLDMPNDFREAKKKAAEARITNARRGFRQGVGVWYHSKMIGDALGENVEVDFIWVDGPMVDGKPTKVLTNSPKAIAVYDRHTRAKFTVLLASQFLNLDIAEAQKNGGTYQALMNTLKRERDEKKNKTKGGDVAPVIKSGDGFIANMLESNAFTGGDDPDPTKIADILKRIGKSKENLLAFGDYAKIIGDMYGEIESDYLTANRTRDAASRAQVAASQAA